MPKTVLITGAGGFIGSAMCAEFKKRYNVTGIVRESASSIDEDECLLVTADLKDFERIENLFRKCRPEIVIHCAGLAHQKLGGVGAEQYMETNCSNSVHLAEIALKHNPKVLFIFLSSVSVYGENLGSSSKGERTGPAFNENDKCLPTSDYAKSKLLAEEGLLSCFSTANKSGNLFILRLAPVYDENWTLNLDRRIFLPNHIFYVKFGKGEQRMSALAKYNLVEFVRFLIDNKSSVYMKKNGHNLLKHQSNNSASIINVTDEEPYSFSDMIKVFKMAGRYVYRPVIHIPLSWVWLLTRFLGCMFPKRKKWLHSCYEKLAIDLIYSNKRMKLTGFQPKYSLLSLFPQSKN